MLLPIRVGGFLGCLYILCDATQLATKTFFSFECKRRHTVFQIKIFKFIASRRTSYETRICAAKLCLTGSIANERPE